MDNIFSDRIADVPKSFIREILKMVQNKGTISFAGGLPSRLLFPTEELKIASTKVFDSYGPDVLQYSTTEGHIELRKWIQERYRKVKGIEVDLDNITITNGSQQGLDLVAKTIINNGDPVGLEEPGYLGAIQAFLLYRPHFKGVTINDDGLELDSLDKALQDDGMKLFYCVPSFQNPSGISHSNENRKQVAERFLKSGTMLIEDDPYGEIQFSGEKPISYYKMMPEQTILLGSMSKIVAPSMRIGWVVAPKPLTEKILIAKQASDLATNYFAQALMHRYLCDNDIDAHIAQICQMYSSQCTAMLDAIADYFPPEVKYTKAQGGMFLWAELPNGLSSRTVLEAAIKENVVFVPGDPFYVNKKDVNTMRLNFSCTNEETTREGIKRLGNIIKTFL